MACVIDFHSNVLFYFTLYFLKDMDGQRPSYNHVCITWVTHSWKNIYICSTKILRYSISSVAIECLSINFNSKIPPSFFYFFTVLTLWTPSNFLSNSCRRRLNFQHTTSRRRLNFRKTSPGTRRFFKSEKRRDPSRVFIPLTK